MGSDLDPIREQLAGLQRQLQEVERRLSRLESKPAVIRARETPRPAPGRHVKTEASIPAPDSEAGFASGNLALVGRTLVVLGGAFAFRAISDRELVAPLAGALAALLYAAFWLLQCDRDAGRGRRRSAIFHGAAGLAIAHPLIWETTLAFELLDAAEAAGLLALVSVIGLVVATRRDLSLVGWAAIVAQVCSGLGLMVATHAYLPLMLSLLASAIAAETLTVGGRLVVLRWPAALGLDLGALLLVTASVHRIRTEAADVAGSGAVAAALLALPLLYLTNTALHTLWRDRRLSAFEGAQTGAALLLGVGGTAWLQLAEGTETTLLGVSLLGLGAVLCAASFVRLERRPEREPGYTTWTSLAGIMVLAGCALALPWGSAALAWAWCGLAALTLGIGLTARPDPLRLSLHAAAYAAAAAGASGLLGASADGMLAPPDAWRPLEPAALGAALVIACGLGALLVARRPGGPWLTHLPRALLTLLLLASLAGLAVRGLSALGPEPAASESHAVLLATIRSAVIALTAIALAWASRRFDLDELRWVVPVLLAVGAAKLLWEDLRMGEPLSLFAGMAVYGGALIAIPRLLRSGPTRPKDAVGAVRVEREGRTPGRAPLAAEHLDRRDRA